MKTILKELKCMECGTIFPIQRKKSKNRAIGHIKHLWCWVCKKITAHCEK